MSAVRKGMRVPILTAEEAAAKIPPGATVAVTGAGGGITEPTSLIDALAERFRRTGEPNGLTLLHTTGLGDRADRGMSPLAIQGMNRRVIGGHWGQSPRLAEMAEANEIEAYCLPQGVISQLFRAAAAGQPGILTHIGLGTCVDPRAGGGKLNARTTEDLVKLMEIDGREWLFYPAVKPTVALLRGTTADTDGYVSMEDEIAYLDGLAMAQATHNAGGLVFVQVKRLVRAGTLHPRNVRIPGFLVDGLIVCPEQAQLYDAPTNRFFSGDYAAEIEKTPPMPLDERKAIVRRALMQVSPGDVGNIGVGVSDGIGAVAGEEGLADDFVLTVETGPIGGITAKGIFFGASVNARALVDMPSQFDFYGGGGLDVCFLSFAEVDAAGNVNVSRFNGKIQGVGGFIDIAGSSKKLVFNGTLTAGGLKTRVGDGRIEIVSEGRFKKFVPQVEEVSFSAEEALKRGKEVLYITERAVFRLVPGGLELIEIAPGMEPERDVFPHMAFRPAVSANLKEMDARFFTDGPMGIAGEWRGKRIELQQSGGSKNA